MMTEIKGRVKNLVMHDETFLTVVPLCVDTQFRLRSVCMRCAIAVTKKKRITVRMNVRYMVCGTRKRVRCNGGMTRCELFRKVGRGFSDFLHYNFSTKAN